MRTKLFRFRYVYYPKYMISRDCSPPDKLSTWLPSASAAVPVRSFCPLFSLVINKDNLFLCLCSRRHEIAVHRVGSTSVRVRSSIFPPAEIKGHAVRNLERLIIPRGHPSLGGADEKPRHVCRSYGKKATWLIVRHAHWSPEEVNQTSGRQGDAAPTMSLWKFKIQFFWSTTSFAHPPVGRNLVSLIVFAPLSSLWGISFEWNDESVQSELKQWPNATCSYLFTPSVSFLFEGVVFKWAWFNLKGVHR